MSRDGIVQIARHIEAGKGVGGVALNLEREFLLQGQHPARLTLESLRLSKICSRIARLHPTAGLLAEVVLYSLAAPIVWAVKYRRTHVGISHNDCVLGDIFVNHGVHKSVVLPRSGQPRYRLLLHPLHLFLLLREELRYRLPGHRVIVNFSRFGEMEHRSYYKFSQTSVAIPNGVDLSRFRYNPSVRATTRRAIGVPDGAFLVLFVGNEFVRKGLDIAVAAVAQSTENIVLVVIGGTRSMISRVDSRGLPHNRLIFMGPRVTDLPDVYAAADLLVLPSAQEAWPLVLLEAMACGVPCLATRVSSIPDLIEDGHNGLLSERNPEAFADAIGMIAADPIQHARMSTAAQETASRYGWDAIAARYLRLVKELS